MKTSRKALEEELRRKQSAKASWVSHNEGVHEKVNFDDTLWGFDLAGGVYYNTVLRVTAVAEGSRASLAGIRPGDVVRRINDIDTSTLTLQQAHEMILESGFNIRLAVTAPDDLETKYNVWQDEIVDDEEERRKKFQFKQRKVHKDFKGAKTNAEWSLMWPWTSKRSLFYRESNCFLVPSRYEQKHPDKIQKKLSTEANHVLQKTESKEEVK